MGHLTSEAVCFVGIETSETLATIEEIMGNTYMKWLQSKTVTLILGLSIAAMMVNGMVKKPLVSAAPPLVPGGVATSQVSGARAQQLRAEIRHLHNQLANMPGARFLGFIDNGCKYIVLTKQGASAHQPIGSNDPRVASCPHSLEHLSPTWDGPPNAIQARIYVREMQLFPWDITFTDATRAMQAALSAS